ncbi:pentapeptide repeat-containing protein [uncultured Flavobacterium sp.]|uniref:pentapeptide repeat-containing protein n=1 Tax=uncultured Flavobacterium sp. TaxID=165435 RepID=UPI0025DDBECF|nr:pentapeptide repeat-containing protein [uncultured Flavobacterium sp.]
MNKTYFAKNILEQYRNGQRYFADLDLSNENFDDENLQNVVFENCNFYSSFRRANLRNAKFINSDIKTCDFREADLRNSHFENLAVESSQFARAKIDEIYFDNNWAYGQKVTKAHFVDWIKDYEE